MKNKLIIIILSSILSFTITLFLVTNAFACKSNEHFVTRVIDGDTIVVKNLGTIRILAIDTPDINSRMAKKQSIRMGLPIKRIKLLSKIASHRATKLLLHECITLTEDYKDTGRYGRYLRYVTIKGKDYQKIMLKEGLANVYCGDKKARKFEEYLKISQFKCN